MRALVTAALAAVVVLSAACGPTAARPSPAAASPTPAASPVPAAAPTAAVPTAMPTAGVTEPPSPVGRDIAGARISVPRLAIDLPLEWGDIGRDVPRDGFAGATPERVALVFPASALPGAGGNTYVYSHARTGMFLSLWNARVGDLVTIHWPDGTSMAYAVARIAPRVDPSDLTWLDPGGPERLTLQTSTGPSAGDPRFIVVALPRGAG